MKTVWIALTQPFVRHPAGLVFELDEATGISGWDDDERVRERQNYSDKRCYRLPDGGNGLACELPVSMTAVCPPEVFADEDLRSGPCRVTGAERVENQTTSADSNLKYGIALAELNGLNAQGLHLPLNHWPSSPKTLRLIDRLRETEILSLGWEVLPDGLLDCSALRPGFYALEIEISSVLLYRVLFIKSFPLLVQMAPNGQYTTLKTLY